MSIDREQVRAVLTTVIAVTRDLMDAAERVIEDDEAIDRLLDQGRAAWTASVAAAPVILENAGRFVSGLLAALSEASEPPTDERREP